MTMTPVPSSWCEIHRDRISKNLELALGLVPNGVRFCAVLKSDAYGHGIGQVVPLLRNKGLRALALHQMPRRAPSAKLGFPVR